MDDIFYSTQEGIISSNKYSDLFEIDKNGKFVLNIFESLKPQIKGNNLDFMTGEVNPNIVGIKSSPHKIIDLWKEYEKKGYPLEDLMQSLYVVELSMFFQSQNISAVTLLVELDVLLEGIDKCKHIKGF
jgi:hypothetical protein